MKKTAKKSPKWGTEEWVVAYPWSKMDKDRRRRVRKELGLKGNPKILEVVDRLSKLVKHTVGALSERNIDMSVGHAQELKFAEESLHAFSNFAVDVLVAYELGRKWKLGCHGKCEGGCKCSSRKAKCGNLA